MKCDLCGKSQQFGFTISHSKRHAKRNWVPNIQSANIIMQGKMRHLHLCTRCLRTQTKTSSVA